MHASYSTCIRAAAHDRRSIIPRNRTGRAGRLANWTDAEEQSEDRPFDGEITLGVGL